MSYVWAIWIVFAIYFLGRRDGGCSRPFSFARFFVRACLAMLWPFVLIYGLSIQESYRDE